MQKLQALALGEVVHASTAADVSAAYQDFISGVSGSHSRQPDPAICTSL